MIEKSNDIILNDILLLYVIYVITLLESNFVRRQPVKIFFLPSVICMAKLWNVLLSKMLRTFVLMRTL